MSKVSTPAAVEMGGGSQYLTVKVTGVETVGDITRNLIAQKELITEEAGEIAPEANKSTNFMGWHSYKQRRDMEEFEDGSGGSE